VLLYLPLGFCLFLWLELRWRRIPSILAATALGSLLSLSIEIAQVYISARVPSLTDLTLNAVGTLLGATAGLAWGGLTRLMHLPGRAARAPGAAARRSGSIAAARALAGVALRAIRAAVRPGEAEGGAAAAIQSA